MQRSESNIGEVIPFLLKLLQDLSKMTLKGEKKLLRDQLVKKFKEKFAYELESSIYCVAFCFCVFFFFFTLKKPK